MIREAAPRGAGDVGPVERGGCTLPVRPSASTVSPKARIQQHGAAGIGDHAAATQVILRRIVDGVSTAGCAGDNGRRASGPDEVPIVRRRCVRYFLQHAANVISGLRAIGVLCGLLEILPARRVRER